MLQKIGDSLKGQKWLAYLVLGVLALVFAAWGAYGIVDLGFGPSNHAAKVNGDTIPAEDVREAWMQQEAQWQQRFNGDIPAADKQRMQDELIESFVQSTLLTQRSRDLGYRVSPEQLREALRNEPAFQLDGKYSAEVAKARLAQAGISVQEYEADLRRTLERAQLQRGIGASDFLTPTEAARLKALENEQREVQYALLPVEKFAADAGIDDAAIKAYYESHQANYMNPEWVRLQYGELRLDQVAAQSVVSDNDLRAFHDKNKERYITPEKRRARHILIEAGKDDAAALKEANEVLAKAQGGADFSALAKERSDDTGSAQQGGDLGWSERTYFVAPFADALFSMKEGEIRGPVKTQFGYHIIRLDGIQPGATKSFEEARAELESEVRRERAADRFGDIEERLGQRLAEGSVAFDELAREFGMQTGEVARFERGVGGDPLGNSPELQELIFSTSVLADRRIGGPVALGEDRIAIVRVLDHKPAAPKPIAEVRDQVVTALRNERGTEAAMKAAEAARQKLESGASLEQVARELGVTAEPARFAGRMDPSLPAQVREEVFAGPKPDKKPIYRAIQLSTGGAALVAITASKVDASAANPELEDTRKRQAAAQRGMGDVIAYIEEARRTAEVDKNPQVFE